MTFDAVSVDSCGTSASVFRNGVCLGLAGLVSRPHSGPAPPPTPREAPASRGLAAAVPGTGGQFEQQNLRLDVSKGPRQDGLSDICQRWPSLVSQPLVADTDLQEGHTCKRRGCAEDRLPGCGPRV